MSFKQQLQEKLREKLSDKELELLPSGFQRIGDIIILNIHEELIKFKGIIGKEVLEMFGVRSVCLKTGEIKGEFREPQIEVISGSKNTETIIKENNCLYKFDVRKLMFAKGNVNERIRIAKLVKKNEVIVDMFAGLGYFSIPIGKLSKAKKLFSIELNPNAFNALEENIKINKIKIIEAIHGDNKKVVENLAEEGIKADRILMGYLPPPVDFLPFAMKIVKSGTILHYEDLIRTDFKKEDIDKAMNCINNEAEKVGLRAKLLMAKKVKSYGPKKDHYVLDVLLM